jgi:hypothetical protein
MVIGSFGMANSMRGEQALVNNNAIAAMMP